MYNSSNPRPKIIFFLAIFVFIFIAIFSIIMAILDSKKTASLEILVAPSFAHIELDEHSLANVQTAKYYPGEYVVTITAPGFQAQERTVSLSADQTTNLYLYLTPDDGDLSFYDNDEQEGILFQEIAEKQYQDNLATFLTEHPIANILPYEHYTQNEFSEPTGYRIDYGKFDGCKSDFCLKVTSYSQTGLTDAKEYIRSKGFNPSDYEILFEYDPLEKSTPDDFPPAIREILEKAGYFD